MALRPGYKETEVGIIPHDWIVRQLGDFVSFRTGPFGSALHKSDYTLDGVPVINPMHIVGGRIEPTRTMTVNEQAAKALSDFRLSVGEIVIGRRGDMGRCAVVQDDQSGWLCGTGSMIIRCAQGIEANFLQRVLSSPATVASITDASVGTTMVNLNQRTLSSLKIQVPPLCEQRSIAGTLADADAYIDSLEKLLEKKRMIKLGVTQGLLTGKTRLPGYRGDWQETRLGDSSLVKARIGWQGLTTAEYRDSGDFGLVTGTELIEGKVAWDKCHFVDEQRYKQDKYIQLRKGDVLVTKDGTIGKVAFVSELPFPATLNSGVFVIRPKDQLYDPQFLFYLLRSRVFVDFLEQLSAGSTINHLYQKDFVAFVFPLPATREEQRAIAKLLSDVDDELQALEAKLSKVRNIKQGMAQQLLTGRIRLASVQPSEAGIAHKAANEPLITLFDSQEFESPINTRNEHNENVVLLTAIAVEFGTFERPLGNVRCVKLAYLVRRHTKTGIHSFLKKAAGPFEPGITHEARSYALKHRYVSKASGKNPRNPYEGLVSGSKYGETSNLFDTWFGNATRQWLRQFQFTKTEELECLATVDFAMTELRALGRAISVESVRSLIRGEPEWANKLKRDAFSDANISNAIALSRKLFGGTPQ